MRTEQEIRDKIASLEKRAEQLYNTGIPRSMDGANLMMHEVEVLKWVLMEAQ
jgi:hypothetical protein